MSSTPNTVHVRGGFTREELAAYGTIYPGALLERYSATQFRVNSKEDDAVAQTVFAVEDSLQGKTVDDAYTSGDRVQANLYNAGAICYGRLITGESVALNDGLASDGAGGLKKAGGGTYATLDTGVVGSNNAITWTSKIAGVQGNLINVALVDPSGNDASLAITVDGFSISVSLATGAGGAITSTPATIIAAIEADAEANELVAVDDTGASTGAAAVAAVAATYLTGGEMSGRAIGLALETLDNSVGTSAAWCKLQVL